MEKILKVTNAPLTGQFIGLNGIKTITTAGATATTVVIKYNDGTSTTVTTAAQVDSDVILKLQSAVAEALVKPWQKPIYEIELPKAVTSIVNA